MELLVSNLPDFIDKTEKGLFAARVNQAVSDMIVVRYPGKRAEVTSKVFVAKTSQASSGEGEKNGEKSDKDKPLPFSLHDPQYTMDQMILEDKVVEELEYSIKFESVKDLVYNVWGLKKIEPASKLALNFHGASGTGKTMAAHALASSLGKKIVLASYAEIESMYHGEGPKNVQKLFAYATENDAVLFIDEADSLLSKRLTNVTQGSEQAINSMRSQLLIEIEKFSGIVIFATNLAQNYDGAFITRIRNIQFNKPDEGMRRRLWETMLLPTLPLATDISVDALSKIEDVCGRDIKNAVVKAAVITAINGDTTISQRILETTMCDIIESEKQVKAAEPKKLTEEEKKETKARIRQSIKKGKFDIAENPDEV